MLARLDGLAQPHAPVVAGDVLDLVGDRAAVGLLEVGQRVGERLAGHRHAQHRRRDAGHELRREAHRGGVERRVAARLGAQRVEPRGQVAVHAVRLDDRRGGLHRLQQRLVRRRRRGGAVARRHRVGGGDRPRRRSPATRSLSTPSAANTDLVEVVLALQQLVDALEEGARLGALDHAVVVGGGHRHDLGHAQLAQALGLRLGQPGRVADRAGGHDRALARHQPRHRGHGADPAGVGQRDLRARRRRRAQRVVARAGHRLVVGGHERGEVSVEASRITGTTSERVPSLRSTSTARPRLTARGSRGAACRRPR